MDGGRVQHVNLYLGDSGRLDDGGDLPVSGRGKVSGHKSVPTSRNFPHALHDRALRRPDAVFDPYAVSTAFPERWRVYLHANFTGPSQVADLFAVDLRAARKWWKGEGGVNGRYTAVAMALHPVQAGRALYPEAWVS